MTVPAFAVVGWKNSGKTTLVERLVTQITRQGLKVGTIKRSHDAFLMDVSGTDTDRHRRAGATKVAMIGPNGWTLAQQEEETPLQTVLDSMVGSDVVIVEGFKHGDLPAIEVVADSTAPPIRESNPYVFAVACDEALDIPLPVHPRDDIVLLSLAALARLGLR